MPTTDVSDTGQGATITFSSTTFAARVVSINLGKWSMGRLDDSVLATTGFRKYIANDLTDHDEIEVTMRFPTKLTLPTLGGTTTQTMTITFPLRTGPGGETTAATLAGTGFFSELGFPTLALGQIQEGTYKISFDGSTGPAFTASA
jgi:hypothetical protein